MGVLKQMVKEPVGGHEPGARETHYIVEVKVVATEFMADDEGRMRQAGSYVLAKERRALSEVDNLTSLVEELREAEDRVRRMRYEVMDAVRRSPH